MMIKIHKLLQDKRGAITVEYIVLIGVLALLLIVGVKAFKDKVNSKLTEQGTSVMQIGNGS